MLEQGGQRRGGLRAVEVVGAGEAGEQADEPRGKQKLTLLKGEEAVRAEEGDLEMRGG